MRMEESQHKPTPLPRTRILLGDNTTTPSPVAQPPSKVSSQSKLSPRTKSPSPSPFLLEEPNDNATYNKPIPLPRRLLKPNAMMETIDSEEDNLDYDAIPSSKHVANQINQNQRSGTINIFKLANQMEDPFDTEFESSINEAEVSQVVESQKNDDEDSEFESSFSRDSFNRNAVIISKLDGDSNSKDDEPRSDSSRSSASMSTSSEANSPVGSKPRFPVDFKRPKSSPDQHSPNISQKYKVPAEKMLSAPLPSFKEEESSYESIPDEDDYDVDFLSSGMSHLPSQSQDGNGNNSSNFSLGKRVTVHNIQHQQHENQKRGSETTAMNHLKFDAIASNQSKDLEPGSKVSRALGLSFLGPTTKRKSIASPTESTDSFIGSFNQPEMILRRSVSNQSDFPVEPEEQTLKAKVVHEYDEVAIEKDGGVSLVDYKPPSSSSSHRSANAKASVNLKHSSNNSSSSNNNSNSNSSLTSRNSVIAEFDPLLTSKQGTAAECGKTVEQQQTPKSKSPLISPNNTILDLNDEEQHRYEYIDSDLDDSISSSLSRNSNSDMSLNPPPKVTLTVANKNNDNNQIQNSFTTSTTSTISTIEQQPSFTADFQANFQDSNENIDEYDEQDEYEMIEPSSSQKSPKLSNASEEGKDPEGLSQSSSNSSLVNQSSFFRRISSKFRPNLGNSGSPHENSLGAAVAINVAASSSGNKGAKSKFQPAIRSEVTFATNLYTSPGLGRKDWIKKRVILAQGKLGFCNDKSEIVSEIPIEKILAISLKDDQRVVSSMPQLKYMELSLMNWKSSSLILAANDDSDRDKWMSKYLEVQTTNVPHAITNHYERGGWCFIKETLMGNWQQGWLILKDRSLFYGNMNDSKPCQLDLRKARSIVLAEKDVEHKCAWTDNSEVLTIDGIATILYVQTESVKVTTSWGKALRTAASFNGTHFHEIQLTLDDIPVIVDKCIDFLYAHGTLAEGIYRQSGSNTRITQLLSDFEKDAWSVQINEKDYNAHDVAGTLKRFFRTRPEPLVTDELYEKWIAVAKISNARKKIEEYQKLLTALPPINYQIMKKLICHLYAVHELHEKNLMPLLNLAPIWGPTLMNVDSGGVQSYERSCVEREVIKDLIESYYTLFRVDEEERAREKKMQDALEHFHLGSIRRKHSGDMKIYIYRWEKDESSAVNMTLSPNSTAQGIIAEICAKAPVPIRNVEGIGLHEIICGSVVERPLHPFEKVIETVLRWSIWDIEERKNNYLILKKNSLYPSLVAYTMESRPLTSELKYADSKSKSFRKVSFNFEEGYLKIYKDMKSKTEISSWKMDDIVWYTGCDSRRSPPTKWVFTFVKKNYPFKRSKEEPYFGNVVSCSSENELYKWIGGLLLGEHPEGLYPSVQV